MATAKTLKPYGLWPSPVTPVFISQRLRLGDVQWDSDGRTLVWLEGRSDRGALVAQTEGDALIDLTNEHSVKGGIGYGGGEFTAAHGKVVFSERNGRLYQRSLSYDQPRPISPTFGAAASPALAPDGRWVVYVFSDGKTDLLALVDVEGRDWPVQLVRGADFYMQPAWHPGGLFLAWIEWDHPNMPWDGSRLKLGRISGEPPRLAEVSLVAGDAQTPVQQPQFSPDGRWLSYILDDGEWGQLVVMNLESGEKRTLVLGDQFHLDTPAWVQGMRFYGWSHTSQKIFYLRYSGGFSTLWVVELENNHSTQIETRPYMWINQVAVSPVKDEVAFIGSATNIPDRIVCWDGRKLRVVSRSGPENLASEALPVPQPVTWKASDGMSVFGLYYPPVNLKFMGSGLPPVIVGIHGGPTSIQPARFAGETAYFTTRGYGWLDVNYRGSSGYGKTYQQALRQNWGIADVEDASRGAQALVEMGLADERRLVIKGSSAGGYTVLNAMVRDPVRFRAGVCLYGVSNLFTLAMDTHKFEAHYLDNLVGALPEASGRYQAWSPLFHADQISNPLAIFQGADDKVVLPNQSEEIVKILRQRGVQHLYRLYEGEGHGFRKNETIQDYLQQVERFLQQNVLFAG